MQGRFCLLRLGSKNLSPAGHLGPGFFFFFFFLKAAFPQFGPAVSGRIGTLIQSPYPGDISYLSPPFSQSPQPLPSQPTSSSPLICAVLTALNNFNHHYLCHLLKPLLMLQYLLRRLDIISGDNFLHQSPPPETTLCNLSVQYFPRRSLPRRLRADEY